MRKLGILAGALMLGAAVPAAAQYQTRYYYGDVDTRIDQVEGRLQRGIENGTIRGSDAAAIRSDIRSLRYLYSQYNRNGLTQWERTELDRRLQTIRSRLQYAMRDNRGRYGDDYYGGQYSDDGRWDDRDDRWNDRDDRYEDRDRWNDQDRWNDRGYGQGGYYAVPDRYSYQYRDTDRYYFRYRDGYVYQFDRNSGRVVNTIWVGRQ